MKLFKFNPGFKEDDNYLFTMTLNPKICDFAFILTLFYGKFAFTICNCPLPIPSKSKFRVELGDFPKNSNKTWWYMLEFWILSWQVFFEISHKPRVKVDSIKVKEFHTKSDKSHVEELKQVKEV